MYAKINFYKLAIFYLPSTSILVMIFSVLPYTVGG